MRAVLLLLVLSAPLAVAQPGTLDPAFGTGGLVVSDLEGYDDFYDLAPLPDGTIAVVGRSSSSVNVPQAQSARYLRYDAAGALLVDREYDNGPFGCFDVPEAFYDVVVEPDGTILAGGFVQTDCGGPQRDFWVHRLQPDGTSQIFARPSFFGVFENTWGLALHPDGRITAGGIASPNTASNTRDFAFTRYTPEGEIDLTFGTMGETTVDAYGDHDFLYDLVAMPDGGVLAAGFAYDGDQYDMLLVRLDPDGMPDPTFGTNGVVTLDFDGDDYVFDLARQADGQILAVGRRENPDGSIQPLVLRLAPDGTLDPDFGTGGIAEVPFGGSRAFANGLVLQADGKIVVAGGAGEDGARDVAIARLLPDGTLDADFGTGGVQTASWSEHDDLARSLAIMPDGDLVVLGITREIVDDERIQDLALARFQGDTPPVANEDDAATPAVATLHAPFPNPAAGQATLAYTLPAAGPVRLAAYDLLGRTVVTLAEGMFTAGPHEATLPTAGLPGGVYVVRLEAGGAVLTQRFTVVR